MARCLFFPAFLLLVFPFLSLPLAHAEVQIVPTGDVVHVLIDGQPFTDFIQRGGDAMKPYLFPLRSASGKIVTRHFPMEKLDGEPTDHPHQRGLWFAHDQVNGIDFWNNEESYKSTNRGRIEVAKIDEAAGGPDSGTLKATLEWKDPKGATLVEESRAMVFRATSKLRIIDFDLTLTAATTVIFGDSKDGTLGLRLAAPLQETATGQGADSKMPATGRMTNAEGLSGEKEVWGKTSAWVDYAGVLDGESVGIAIFDHPRNPRAAHWHVRGYGLFAANAFGSRVFGEKEKDGAMKLQPGEKLRFRYRVIIHPGDTASAGLPTLWREYLEQTP